MVTPVCLSALPVDVSVALHPPAQSSPAAVAIHASASGNPRASITTTLSAPGHAVLDLATDLLWSLKASAPGYWCESKTIFVKGGEPQPAVKLVMWRTGRVRGRLLVQRASPLPSEASLRFEATPKHEVAGVPKGDVRCPVANGAFECEVPGTWLDLRLRVLGCPSHFFWGVKVPSGGVFDAGSLSVRPGASVIGWVKTADGTPAGNGCTVDLSPVGEESRDLRPEEQLRAKLMHTLVRTNDRGFFHLDGVAPGAYVLTAQLAGFAPASVFPVLVLENAEATVREPLTLAHPLTLRAVVKPETDPQGRAWLMTLYQQGVGSGQFRRVSGPRVADKGLWEATGLAPGRYDVRVTDADHSDWLSQPVELGQEAGPLEILMPVIPIEGSVTLGREPLACTVWFGGRRGHVSIRFTADSKGCFHGSLPRDGPWPVTVASQRPQVRRELENVKVRREEGASVARVDINLPDTSIRGRVTDEAANPVADATVSCRGLMPKEPAVSQPSDSEGRFEFQGMAEGEVVLEAAKKDMSSEPVELHVAETARPEPVQLVLRKVSRLFGHVLGPNGPVLAATVDAFPIGHAGGGARDISGVDGKFSMSVPSWAGEVALIVMPPGLALHTERVRLSEPEENEIVVQVGPSPGTLVLKLKDGMLDPSKTTYFLVHNGSLIGPAILGEWARMNGVVQSVAGEYRVPALESGGYVACMASVRVFPALLAGVLPAEAQCSYLPPNGELNLELPAPQ